MKKSKIQLEYLTHRILTIHKDYTIILVQDCTGDLFIGSRKKLYSFTLPTGDIQWEINHNGFGNIISTLLEVNNNDFGIDFDAIEELSLIGDSSGGYGSLYVLPHLEHMMPAATITTIVDSSAGASNSYFFKAALWDSSDQESTSWGVENNLFPSIGFDESFMESLTSDSTMLLPGLITILCETWPEKLKLGTVNTNFDLIQIVFYKLIQAYENPLITDEQAAIQWYPILVENVINRLSALTNYRHIIDAGTFHSIFKNEEYYTFIADDITLYDWNKYMIKDDKVLWKNVDEGPPV